MWSLRIICSSSLLFLPLTVCAQNRAVPVTVTVSVVDGGERVQPLRFVVYFIPERGGERIGAQTDWQGKAELTLRPGRYRVQSAAPLRLPTIEYIWDLSYTVEPVEAVRLELTEANARTTPPIRPPIRPGEPLVRPVPPDTQEARPAERPQPQVRRPAPPELSLGQQGYKDPSTARLLALIPGGGHLYSGETAAGLGLLLGAAALVGTGFMLRDACDDVTDKCDNEHTLSTVAFGAAVGVALFSIVDAGASARRANRRNAQRLLGFLRLDGMTTVAAGVSWAF